MKDPSNIAEKKGQLRWADFERVSSHIVCSSTLFITDIPALQAMKRFDAFART